MGDRGDAPKSIAIHGLKAHGCYKELQQVLGVVDVRIERQLGLLGWTYGFSVEQNVHGQTIISKTKSKLLRQGDVILAVNKVPIIDQDPSSVQFLIDRLDNLVTLTLDTRKSWPQTRKKFENKYLRQVLKILNFFDSILEANVTPHRKMLHTSGAMFLLLPVMRSYWISLCDFGLAYGPLLVHNQPLLLIRDMWMALFMCSIFLTLCSYQATIHVPAYAITIVSRLRLILSLLKYILLSAPVMVIATMMIEGFTVPPFNDDSQLEVILQGLLGKLILVTAVPFFIRWYLIRFGCFCTAYLCLLQKNHKLLHLEMPLSSHFGPHLQEKSHLFKELRSHGY